MSDSDSGSDSGSDGARTDNIDKVVPNKRNPLVMGLVIVAIIALILFVGKRISDNIVPDVPGVTLTDVHTIEDLRSRFNQDQGAPRLILLVSPT